MVDRDACSDSPTDSHLTDDKCRPHTVSKARFPFKRNRLRCVRCVNENRKKRKRLRWQAANHGFHCFTHNFIHQMNGRYKIEHNRSLSTEHSYWLALEIFTQQTQAPANGNARSKQWQPWFCLPTQALAFLAVFVYATHATQAIAFEWKPGLTYSSQYTSLTELDCILLEWYLFVHWGCEGVWGFWGYLHRLTGVPTYGFSASVIWERSSQ